jgi:hypothetical protein
MARTTVRSKIRLAKAQQASEQQPKADDAFTPPIEEKEVRLNPLSDLIDDPSYNMLEQHKLIDQKALRDYLIRKSFREMRERMSAGDAIDKLQQQHPYLQFDTIRKIVYQMKSS